MTLTCGLSAESIRWGGYQRRRRFSGSPLALRYRTRTRFAMTVCAPTRQSVVPSPRETPYVTKQLFDLEGFRKGRHDSIRTSRSSRGCKRADDKNGSLRKAGIIPQASDELIPTHDRHLQIEDD